MEIRTSELSPIEVSWLPVGLAGKLGLTLAPGRHGWSTMGFRWERDLGADLDRLAEVHGASLLVCLLEDHELERMNLRDYVPEAVKRGLEVMRYPIPDGGVPASAGAVAGLVEGIAARVRAGGRVVVHCAAGLGRSGVIGGCALVALGHSPEQASAALHEHRSLRSPETTAQERFIHAYAAHRAAARYGQLPGDGDCRLE